MGSHLSLRRAVSALAMSAAAAATLIMTAPAAVAAPQDKPIRVLDQCDKPTWDATPGFQGVCLLDAGSVDPTRFTADLSRGGNNNWWINNRNETINAGDTLVVSNGGGEAHPFTEVNQFGQGIIPPFNAAVPNDPAFDQLGGEAVIPSVFATIVAPTADNPFGAATQRRVSNLTVGTHRFQCVFHPWMRTTVTVR